MKKEVLFAIFLGLGLGLIVTFGIYTARSAFLKKTDTTDVSPTATPAATPTDSSLSLFSPDDESVQFVSDVKVTGTTFPNAHVIVFINNTSNITTADATGNFSVATTLTEGSNVVTVRALDDNGNQAEQKRTVIYTTTTLDAVATATPSASPTTKTASSSAKTPIKVTPTPVK
ncbi:hypothetical protein BH10PAT2_BH10PAT2_3480 [soil metagenome]